MRSAEAWRSVQGDARKQPFWLYPNLLSLDAPAVAAVWLWLFAASEGIELLPSIYWTLAGVVWLVYAVDRWLDARTAPDPEAGTDRLAFHARHSGILGAAIAAVGGVTLWAILFKIPELLLLHGIFAGALVVIYLLPNLRRLSRAVAGGVAAMFGAALMLAVVQVRPSGGVVHLIMLAGAVCLVAAAIRPGKDSDSRLVPSEIACGLIFAVGVLLPVFVFSMSLFVFALLALAFGALCALNCVLISIVERSRDAVSDAAAIAVRSPTVEQAFPWLALGFGALPAYLAMSDSMSPAVAAALVVAAAGLLAVWAGRRQLGRRAARVLADVSLLSPLAAIPWAGP